MKVKVISLLVASLSLSQAIALPRPSLRKILGVAGRASSALSVSADEPTPAAKLLEVSLSAAGEAIVLLCFIRLCALAVGACQSDRSRAIVTAIAWIAVVQGSSRLQGITQSSTEVINPDWYQSLSKPVWQPPPWAFPVVWIPLKILQIIAASRLWANLDYKSFTEPSMVFFMLHLALGDVWNRQFFVKQRMLTGLLVIYTFWIVLTCTTVLFSLSSTLSASLLVPTVIWVFIASALNLDIWWLNRNRLNL
ncbi:MAG: hypothetical protein SGPRY_002930 [Prymnesium sp.]